MYLFKYFLFHYSYIKPLFPWTHWILCIIQSEGVYGSKFAFLRIFHQISPNPFFFNNSHSNYLWAQITTPTSQIFKICIFINFFKLFPLSVVLKFNSNSHFTNTPLYTLYTIRMLTLCRRRTLLIAAMWRGSLWVSSRRGLIPSWRGLISSWRGLVPRWRGLMPRWRSLIPRWWRLIPSWRGCLGIGSNWCTFCKKF